MEKKQKKIQKKGGGKQKKMKGNQRIKNSLPEKKKTQKGGY